MAVFECEPLHIRLQPRLGLRIHQASQEACEKMDCRALQSPGYPAALRRETEQLCCSAAEDVGLVVVAERCRGENMVYRLQLPGIGIVAAEHDLTGADLGHQMADGLG